MSNSPAGSSAFTSSRVFCSVVGLSLLALPAFGQDEPIVTDSTNFFVRGFAFAFILWAFGFGLRLVSRVGAASRLDDI